MNSMKSSMFIVQEEFRDTLNLGDEIGESKQTQIEIVLICKAKIEECELEKFGYMFTIVYFCLHYFIRTVIHQLYNRRKKFLHEGTETEKFKMLTIEYMSNESSEDEHGNIKVHQPIWRSPSQYYVCLV